MNLKKWKQLSDAERDKLFDELSHDELSGLVYERLGNCAHEEVIEQCIVINTMFYQLQCTKADCRKRFTDNRHWRDEQIIPDYFEWDHAGPLLVIAKMRLDCKYGNVQIRGPYDTKGLIVDIDRPWNADTTLCKGLFNLDEFEEYDPQKANLNICTAIVRAFLKGIENEEAT